MRDFMLVADQSPVRKKKDTKKLTKENDLHESDDQVGPSQVADQ